MELEKDERTQEKRTGAILPTVCFVLLALLFLFGAVRLLIHLLPEKSERDAISATPFPVSTVRPNKSHLPEPVNEVLAVVSPPPPSPAAGTAAPTTPSDATPTPGSAITRRKAKSAFTGEQMDFLIVGHKENGSPDCVAAVSIRGSDCTVLFLPVNTLSGGFGLLNESHTLPRTIQAVESVLPVDFSRYITLRMDGAASCIDALGGVEIAGKTVTGREASALLADRGSDELLRINAQQKLIDAFLVRLKSAGLLRFAALKAALEKYADGNLTASQYLKLYQSFRRIEPASIVYRILPVDSDVSGGTRCYRPDADAIDTLVQSLYG